MTFNQRIAALRARLNESEPQEEKRRRVRSISTRRGVFVGRKLRAQTEQFLAKVRAR